MASGKGAGLSKNVLKMKFMQRSVLRIEKEQNEEERQKVIDDEHWVLNMPEYQKKEEKYTKDQSYCVCEELLFGRQSYKGFNPDIEKLMASQNKKQELEKAEKNEKESGVSEVEMAQRYSSLMGIIAKKFAKKRQRVVEDDEDKESQPRSEKFLKPSEDWS